MSERFVGRYEVREKIGVGAAGIVYRGADGRKTVAIKLMGKDRVDEDALKKLKEAAPTLAQLRHPMIASFLDLFETEKAICVVTQLAPGTSLASQLKQGAWPDPRHVWDIARQILDALSLAHGRGLFHGGITPNNVLIDDDENVTLTDFGLAGLVPSANAPEFMAPEQLDGRPVDARTDLYQVGALVYLLMTGLAPFSGTRDEVIHLVRQQRPADPSSLKAKIAWQLDWVIQRALSKDPMDRFGAAREFLDGLRLGLQETLGKPLPLPVIPAMPPEPAVVPAPKPAPAPNASPAPTSTPATASKPAVAAEWKPAAATPLPLEPMPRADAAPKPAAALSLEPVPEAVAEPKLASAAPATLAAKAKILANAAPAPAEKKPPVEDKRMRVLFVDDDERVLNGLEALFRQDYRVLTAKDGASALALARAEAFQIVVSDQRMPGMTGVEVLREMRKISPHSVRMLLTGYSDLAAMVGSINDGEVFRFVKKPWDNDEIRATLADAAALATKLAQVPARPAAPPATVPAKVDAPTPPAAPAMPAVPSKPAAPAMPPAPSTPPASVRPVAPAKPIAPAKPVAPVAAGKPPASAVPAAPPKTGAPQAAPGAAPSIRSAGSLLVIDPSGVLGKGLERLVTGEATVHSATSVPQAAKILQHQDVAAVIADLGAGKNDLITLFKLLKSKRPQTLSILVCEQPDSEVVVELINQAQVHRLLSKPVNVRELRSHVSEALRRYAAFNQRTKPAMPSPGANRTRPAPAPATTKSPT